MSQTVAFVGVGKMGANMARRLKDCGYVVTALLDVNTQAAADLAACVPVYETHQGWKQDLSGIKKFADLPELAKAYLKRLEELTGARISLVGVGPDREQTLVA